jgi:RNA polymerase sigma-70 factor (ECF subfamily)
MHLVMQKIQDLDTVSRRPRWSSAEAEALSSMLCENAVWIRSRIRRRLGSLLRRSIETEDVFQEVVVELLRCGPRILHLDPRRFHSFAARVVDWVLGHQYDWFAAERRSVRREEHSPWEEGSPPGARGCTAPAEAAMQREGAIRVRLCLESLGEKDRELVSLRVWEGLSHIDIGRALGISKDAARMRFERVLDRVASAWHGA